MKNEYDPDKIKNELQEITSDIKERRRELEWLTRKLKLLEERKRILELKLKSNGDFGPRCKHWQTGWCAGFCNCIYSEICEGNNLRTAHE